MCKTMSVWSESFNERAAWSKLQSKFRYMQSANKSFSHESGNKFSLTLEPRHHFCFIKCSHKVTRNSVQQYSTRLQWDLDVDLPLLMPWRGNSNDTAAVAVVDIKGNIKARHKTEIQSRVRYHLYIHVQCLSVYSALCTSVRVCLHVLYV